MELFTRAILNSEINSVYSTVYNEIPVVGEFNDYTVKVVASEWTPAIAVTTASWTKWSIDKKVSPFTLTFYMKSIGDITFKFKEAKEDDLFVTWYNGIVSSYLLNPDTVRYTVVKQLKITGTYIDSTGKQKKLPYGIKFEEPWYPIAKNLLVLGTNGKPLETKDTLAAFGNRQGTPMKQ